MVTNVCDVYSFVSYIKYIHACTLIVFYDHARQHTN